MGNESHVRAVQESGSGTAELFTTAELNNHLSDTPWRVQTSRKQRERQ